MLSPPRSTLSMARRGSSGPQPLRGIQGSEIYDLKFLKRHEKKKAQEGNVLALRAHSTASHASRHMKPWILEQPHEREEKPSMFKMEEHRELEKDRNVRRSTFDQCRFGCEFEEKTDLTCCRILIWGRNSVNFATIHQNGGGFHGVGNGCGRHTRH